MPGGEHERAEYTLRRALKCRAIAPAAQLMQQVGLTTTLYYAQRLGIASQLPMVPSLALGTGEVTLLELTAAYSAFANKGSVAAPRLVLRVEDAEGTGIWFADEHHVQAISPTTAYLMSSMLSDVVSSGTGARARAAGFTLPAAGKTGTTDDYADAWFVGYTPHLLTGVWFGMDQPAPIMREGFAGTVAVPAWARFMTAATKGSKPEWYRMPSDVEKVAICRLSGMRAGPRCNEARDDSAPPEGAAIDAAYVPAVAVPPDPDEPAVYEDLFPVGSMPSEICPLHDRPARADGSSASSTPWSDAADWLALVSPPASLQPGAAIGRRPHVCSSRESPAVRRVPSVRSSVSGRRPSCTYLPLDT
jgi:membrane carboxypeptidase/penicillin-binding protein